MAAIDYPYPEYETIEHLLQTLMNDPRVTRECRSNIFVLVYPEYGYSQHRCAEATFGLLLPHAMAETTAPQDVLQQIRRVAEERTSSFENLRAIYYLIGILVEVYYKEERDRGYYMQCMFSKAVDGVHGWQH